MMPEEETRAIAHDLNNLLAAMIGYADFLRDDLQKGSQQHQFAEAIHRGGTEAQNLVARLLGGNAAASQQEREAFSGPVLVVEDQMDVREMMLVMLDRLGLQAEASIDGLAAIDRLREKPGYFKLVIADQSMPEMTGSELAVTIEEDFPGLPVILMSGQGEKELEKLRNDTPSIRAVLSKPVDFQKLSGLLLTKG